MNFKPMLKSIVIFVSILILFSSTIVYLSYKMINDALEESNKEVIHNTIESIAPLVKTSIDFSLNSFLNENLNQIVLANNRVLKIEIKDNIGNIVAQSNSNINTNNKVFVSKEFMIGTQSFGKIYVYPSNIQQNNANTIFKDNLFKVILSIPFLIAIAVFLYGSIIALHNKDKEKAYDELKKKMDEEIENHQKKTNMLFHQSRLASMGEMISNIAHQWRQPLNTVSLVLQNLKMSFALNNLDKKQFDESMDKIDNSLQYMSQTITTFRNYYKTNEEEPEVFTAKEVIDESISIIGNSLENANINILINNIDDADIKGFKNELTQVLVNILVNAKDVIEKRNTQDAKISIKTFKANDNDIIISIEDNAGGIEEDIMDKIFDPYFTTKHKDQGTGLGLFMSKVIIKDKFEGNLTAINSKDGARFNIELKINNK